MQLLFVYGSLKRGYRHHRQLDGAEFAGDACTAAGYRLVRCGEYPALVCSGGAGVVLGEVFRVDGELLERLDVFEGCPELYQRGRVRLGDGSEAIAYLKAPGDVEGCPELPGGCW